jgi:large subunit ribosomal protein L7Ae
MSKEMVDKVLEAFEIAKKSGKIKKGTNEVTKALERGTAKLVVYASDVNPKEIIMHLPHLAKEKNIPCFEAGTREELGNISGINIPTTALAIINEGDAKAIIKELHKKE